MTDIVERLRDISPHQGHKLLRLDAAGALEAKDAEIEQLRCDLEYIKEAAYGEVDNLKGEIELLRGALEKYTSCGHGAINCPCTSVARAVLGNEK